MPGRPTATPVAALVASVGGLDALSRVLSTLPADLQAAYVALQHTNPDRHSQPAGILDPVGPLTATEAQDGSALVPGAVLVAPSGHHTLAASGRTITLFAVRQASTAAAVGGSAADVDRCRPSARPLLPSSSPASDMAAAPARARCEAQGSPPIA